MKKGRTYHRLLEQYIEQTGQHERLARSWDLPAPDPHRKPNAPIRTTLLMPADQGKWELWLMRGIPDTPSFYLEQAGRFRNRKLGEIVADYKLKAEAEIPFRNADSALTGNDDCHLSLGPN